MVVNILLKPQERGPSTTVISIKAQLREIAMIRGSAPYLTLRAALAANRLDDFVRQEEARGVELCSGSDFERALALFLVQRGLRRAASD